MEPRRTSACRSWLVVFVWAAAYFGPYRPLWRYDAAFEGELEPPPMVWPVQLAFVPVFVGVACCGQNVGSAAVPPVMVGPSVLAADLADLANEATRAVQAGADFLHLDIFDGNWIPGAFSFGPMVVKALRKHEPDAFFDAHLCVTDPRLWVRDLAEAGANRVTFHFEAVGDPLSLAEYIRDLGMQVGLALSPTTLVDDNVLKLVPHFNVVLVMSVLPGFGGQSFMPEVLPKLTQLRSAFPQQSLEVDGGVNPTTIKAAAAAGASEAVAGTAVFKAKDPESVITSMRAELSAGLRAFSHQTMVA